MSADRNLLFGTLALQLDYIGGADFTASLADSAAQGRSVGECLVERHALTPEQRASLDGLVDALVRRDAAAAAESLARIEPPRTPLKPPDVSAPTPPPVDARGTLLQAAPPCDGATPPQPRSASATRFRVVRPHARGGLGQVSVALDGELNREVALKEILGGRADDPDSRARFLLEAEVTGGLEHPGIVPVYSLGTYPDGRPFYAMRLIRGDSLHDAIQKVHASGAAFDSLDFRQLLGRFVSVCQSIAYAHSRGVLHRDLKPANVMVGKYGETLVVDWGLAKARGQTPAGDGADAERPLRPLSGGDRSATVEGQAVGTPAYMSPEQADGRLDQMEPASDIYSLGATLYELLAGKRPFVAATIGDVVAKVKRGDFPPPRQHRADVPRALEAVCLKAMALKPGDRYASALDLAKDVERWLADEPVSAYPEPLGARLRRWVRKHARLVTGVGVALAVGVVGLSIGSVLLAAAERRERSERVAKETALTRAEQERDRALAARKRTREALDAMVSEATGDSLTTQKALSAEQRKFLQGVLVYYEEFAAEPGEDQAGRERLALAHGRLGAIRYRLGQREEGVAVFRRTAELYGQLAADFPAVPSYRSDLGRSHLNLGLLLDGLGKRPEAEAIYRAALALHQALAADFPAVPDYRRDLARSHNNLGKLLAGLGKRPEAEVAYRAALAVQQALAADFPAVPDYRRDLGHSHLNLGKLLADIGKRPEAEAAYRAALTLYQALAADFPAVPDYRCDLAVSHNNLGNLLADLGKRPEAEAAYRAALTLQQALAADFPAVPDYRRELAVSHNNLGVLLAGLGKRPEAEVAYRAALALHQALAADFPAVPVYRSDLARSRMSLADLLARNGDAAGAVAAAEAVLASADDADTLYNGACIFAVASAAAGNADADAHAARAVDLLRQAVAKGYHDLPHMLADADLAALRRRDDFAALLWDLADGPVSRGP